MLDSHAYAKQVELLRSYIQALQSQLSAKKSQVQYIRQVYNCTAIQECNKIMDDYRIYRTQNLQQKAQIANLKQEITHLFEVYDEKMLLQKQLQKEHLKTMSMSKYILQLQNVNNEQQKELFKLSKLQEQNYRNEELKERKMLDLNELLIESRKLQDEISIKTSRLSQLNDIASKTAQQIAIKQQQYNLLQIDYEQLMQKHQQKLAQSPPKSQKDIQVNHFLTKINYLQNQNDQYQLALKHIKIQLQQAQKEIQSKSDLQTQLNQQIFRNKMMGRQIETIIDQKDNVFNKQFAYNNNIITNLKQDIKAYLQRIQDLKKQIQDRSVEKDKQIQGLNVQLNRFQLKEKILENRILDNENQMNRLRQTINKNEQVLTQIESLKGIQNKYKILLRQSRDFKNQIQCLQQKLKRSKQLHQVQLRQFQNQKLKKLAQKQQQIRKSLKEQPEKLKFVRQDQRLRHKSGQINQLNDKIKQLQKQNTILQQDYEKVRTLYMNEIKNSEASQNQIQQLVQNIQGFNKAVQEKIKTKLASLNQLLLQKETIIESLQQSNSCLRKQIIKSVQSQQKYFQSSQRSRKGALTERVFSKQQLNPVKKRQSRFGQTHRQKARTIYNLNLGFNRQESSFELSHILFRQGKTNMVHNKSTFSMNFKGQKEQNDDQTVQQQVTF